MNVTPQVFPLISSRADALGEQPFIKLMPVRCEELIAATEGLKKTGVPLVSVQGDSLFPTVGYIDDVGLYYFVPKIAAFFGLSPALAWDLFFLLVVIPCFAVGLWATMRLIESRPVKVVFALVALALFVVVVLAGDVYAISPSLVVLVVPFLMEFSKSESPPKPAHWIWFVLLGAAIALAHYVRSHSATAILLFLFILLVFEKRWAQAKKLAAAGAVLIGALSVTLFFKTRLVERDAYLAKFQPNYVAPPQGHPFWPNVYIGFGFLDNDFGLRYRDEVAYKKVREFFPNATRLDEEHERVLRNEIIALCLKHPLFVVRTLAAKAGVIGFYLLLFGNIGWLCALRYGLKWQIELAFLAGMAFNALPGFLAVPNIPYLTGSFAFAAIYGALQLDNALRRGFLKTSST